MFHAHHDEMTQMGMGLIGMFVVHPRHSSPDYRVDRDFSLMISEWSVKAGTARPNTLEMTDFNILTINGKVFPSTAPLVCRTGDRVRIRMGNLGAMDHHPMHIHGHFFRVTATDGGDIPLAGQWPENTVLVGVGQTRNIEFVADAPGAWAFHCHMTHHVMNQMGHEFPNMVGVKPAGLDDKVRPLLPAYMTHGHTGMDMGKMAEIMPYPPNTISMKGATGPFGDYISMGGLLTIVKVRDELKSYEELRRGSRLVPASAGNGRGQGQRRGARARRHQHQRAEHRPRVTAYRVPRRRRTEPTSSSPPGTQDRTRDSRDLDVRALRRHAEQLCAELIVAHRFLRRSEAMTKVQRSGGHQVFRVRWRRLKEHLESGRGQLEILDAQVSLTRARFNAVAALAEYNSALAMWLRGRAGSADPGNLQP